MLKCKRLRTGLSIALFTAALAFAGCAHTSDSSDDNGGSSQKNETEQESGESGNTDVNTPAAADVSNETVKIVKSEGLRNSAYIIFEQVDGATYKVLCDGEQLDDALVRSYSTYTYYTASESDGQTTWTKNTLSNVVRADALDRAHVGLDYFDASINRIGAYIIGTRATQKCILSALLEPLAKLREFEAEGKGFQKLALLEEAKTLPFGAVFDYFNYKNGVPVGEEFIPVIEKYEREVTSKR